jgi:hypothetical protein
VGLDREAAVAEHLDHLVVVGQDLGAEHPDAGLVGDLGELAEQDRAQPPALHGVGDRQGDLGPVLAVRVPLPAGVGQHPAVAGGRDQAVAPLVVDLGGPADGAVEVGEAGEEPQPSRLRRQALEERAHGRRVGGSDRPHVHGRAIPQGHIDLAVPPIRHLHHSSVNMTSDAHASARTSAAQSGGAAMSPPAWATQPR